ncbi:MAG: HAD-IB family phosphatase [Candidatus Poseidoniia archaeon]|jgi:phosphoserine phosphatase|nr:HAD-IB family phosphatase [Candidatus Poseidoniia archaeon]MDP6658152.1 HAD-IB family phosphatase [Candidatus Poseidoniia archaeon]MDP6846509.1 HAD-IB family phosphatase [Candidatus Poseidoniia archaeon]MDP7007314.1 HAD-IB family phosphatase [Candidatus Poseidoniia archaeon]|tara:strand:- start:1676 stop:2311 length:636 start_codon:yes stop_codon:yes gene_type:complete
MRFTHVCFDCDSTLSQIEGIDWLAAQAGADVAALTRQAMEGELPLEEVYARRLELVRPKREALSRLGDVYVTALVDGAAEAVAALGAAGVAVHLVSAGLQQALLPLAAALGVPPERLHAVELRFDRDGNYAGFEAGPLTRSGGKREVVATIMADGGACAFVGDGITDLETRDDVAMFIGFGGVVRRRAVEAACEHYITELRELPAMLLESA